VRHSIAFSAVAFLAGKDKISNSLFQHTKTTVLRARPPAEGRRLRSRSIALGIVKGISYIGAVSVQEERLQSFRSVAVQW
jgi:hypothetical protein